MSAMEMLLELGKKDGLIINEKFVFIPEVMILGEQICAQVHSKITKLGANPMASCGFCAYAGIGATYLWNVDFASFQKGNIIDQLSKPRGFECMDEFITDAAGFKHAEIEQHLKMASIVTIGNTPDAKTAFDKCLVTMFNYGMTIEMNKLGLT